MIMAFIWGMGGLVGYLILAGIGEDTQGYGQAGEMLWFGLHGHVNIFKRIG